MILTSALLLLYTAVADGYFLHSIIFLLFFAVYGSILVYKYRIDSNVKENIN